MTCGIYCYKDNENNDEIVYIGKDSYIDKRKRDKAHKRPSYYNHQQINRVIQNNPSRYKYEVLEEFGAIDDNLFNLTEILYISNYRPKFNFTKGGDGIKGFKHSDLTKEKMRKAKIGKKLSEEHKKKLRKPYPRIVKTGFVNGKQKYAIYMDGNRLKESFYIPKLIKWFKKNYPNEKIEWE